MNIETLYIPCECKSLAHLTTISASKEDVWISIHLNHYLPFWKRVTNALRYIFKKENDGYYGETLVSKEDRKKIIDFLNKTL